MSCVYVCLTLLRAVYQSDWPSFQPCVCPSDLAVCQAVWVCACPCVSYLTFLWTVCMSSCLSVWSCSGLVVCPRVRSTHLLNKKEIIFVCDFSFCCLLANLFPYWISENGQMIFCPLLPIIGWYLVHISCSKMSVYTHTHTQLQLSLIWGCVKEEH